MARILEENVANMCGMFNDLATLYNLAIGHLLSHSDV